jgi:hypothetical protein
MNCTKMQVDGLFQTTQSSALASINTLLTPWPHYNQDSHFLRLHHPPNTPSKIWRFR